MISSDEITNGVTVIDPSLTRLYQLFWQPGAWMDAGWWSYLDLGVWQAQYTNLTACRKTLDTLIVSRRNFPVQKLPVRLSDYERHLLAVEKRLPALVTALGLIALGCRHHLVYGEYRRALAPVLNDSECNQLLILWPADWNLHTALIAACDLPGLALSHGTQWLNQASYSIVWRALSMTLPPVAAELPVPALPVSIFSRLVRLL